MSAARFTVLLTSCIAPRTAPGLSIVRSDPAVRLRDYEAGLRFWLHLEEPRVESLIFMDNSGHPLESLERLGQRENRWARKLEFIGIDGNHVLPGLSYGYSEFRLLDEGLARSRLYAESDQLIKATGRYRFPDITRLLSRLPDRFKVAADCRKAGGLRGYPRQFTTAALILFSREFFEAKLRLLYREMRPAPAHRKQFIEDLIYDAIVPLAGQPGVHLRWPVNCDPAGVGANGDAYDSRRKQLVALIRGAGRVVAPNWWL